MPGLRDRTGSCIHGNTPPDLACPGAGARVRRCPASVRGPTVVTSILLRDGRISDMPSRGLQGGGGGQPLYPTYIFTLYTATCGYNCDSGGGKLYLPPLPLLQYVHPMDSPKLTSPHHRPLHEGGGEEIPEAGGGGGGRGGCNHVKIIQPDPCNNDRAQPKMYTFSTYALILWHQNL